MVLQQNVVVHIIPVQQVLVLVPAQQVQVLEIQVLARARQVLVPEVQVLVQVQQVLDLGVQVLAHPVLALEAQVLVRPAPEAQVHPDVNLNCYFIEKPVRCRLAFLFTQMKEALYLKEKIIVFLLIRWLLF